MASEPSAGTELRRKGLHLLALIIPWGMLHVQKDTAFFVLGLAGTLSLGLDLGRAYFTPVAQLVNRVGGALMRPEETSSLRGQIVINGSTWIIITAFLLLLLFPANIASLALVIFLLGDAAAGLI
ncbi:MAG: diacylglycerol/polyprenol kinase family protein, partial [Thermodesulfobacteriota bacterium]